ncbi:hypothetical protein VNI00_016348 [Paramarasmius palmivorus]|uniref:Uncharacterized protein n=1 Tax=Paramarasmius palmivorus TaxID=297713 RepID=A0AAW0BEK3_9AGAR
MSTEIALEGSCHPMLDTVICQLRERDARIAQLLEEVKQQADNHTSAVCALQIALSEKDAEIERAKETNASVIHERNTALETVSLLNSQVAALEQLLQDSKKLLLAKCEEYCTKLYKEREDRSRFRREMLTIIHNAAAGS